ncbi:MAG TPA: hypothetical protein VMB91_04485 [Solirubrobacteraceae bacterium]|nr:hypothetical protein [Solirubrobacteraceae bacterium]
MRVLQPVWEPAAPSWAAYEVGPGERSVVVGYFGGGCGERGAAATAVEAHASVTVQLRTELATYPGEVISCPSQHLTFLHVGLRHPLDGRELVGASNLPRANAVCSGGCPTTFTVPDVVGFSLKDAQAALALVEMQNGIHRSGCQHSPARRGVVTQAPTHPHEAAIGTRVHLCVAGRSSR